MLIICQKNVIYFFDLDRKIILVIIPYTHIYIYMQPIEAKEVQRIAELSKIIVHEDELDTLTQDFNQILEFVHIIDKLDVTEAEPLQAVFPFAYNFRADLPEDGIPVNVIQKIAPKFEAGYFVVPKII